MESRTRVVWKLKNILSQWDLETLALSKDACCVVQVGDKEKSQRVQLRFFFEKFEMINEFQSRVRYLSLNVDLLNDEGQCGNEETRFAVKVDLLTNYLQFRSNLLSETEVIIKSEEGRRGNLVEQKFLKYLYSPIPPNGYLGRVRRGVFILRPSLSFGITVTLTDSTTPLSKRVKKGGRLMSMIIGGLRQMHQNNNLFDKKLIAKSTVYLCAKSFIKAVWSPEMIRNKEQNTGETEVSEIRIRVPPPFDFDPKRFLRAIWQWLYTGELEESTGKWIQDLMTRITSVSQLTQLLNRVEWSANNICGIKSDDLELQRYVFGVEMRNEMVKIQTLRRFSEFLGEFWNIISPFLNP